MLSCWGGNWMSMSSTESLPEIRRVEKSISLQERSAKAIYEWQREVFGCLENENRE
jgi:hypothetical protein